MRAIEVISDFLNLFVIHLNLFPLKVSQGTTGTNAVKPVANASPSTRKGNMSSGVLLQTPR